jgi:toxin HigB-1
MIRSFRHDGIERFFRTGSMAGIQPKHAKRLRLQLGRLDAAKGPGDMDIPGWRLHCLAGELAGHWAVRVDENYRLTFRFAGTAVESVDYRDYH